MKRQTRGLWSLVALLGVPACECGAGRTAFFTAIDPPAASGAMAPTLAIDPEDNGLLLAWLEPKGGDARALRLARFAGATWSEPTTIVAGQNLVANWADVPQLGVGHGGLVVVSWAQKSADDDDAYDVALARSTDGGRSWTQIGRAHDDATLSEHGFVSLVPDGDAIRAFWLDGREMAAGHGRQGGGAMTLRTALVRDGVTDGVRIDARVCECCGTTAVSTSHGTLVFYRDRSAEEVRDVHVIRLSGASVSTPRAVHHDGWRVPGCPVNGPQAAADGERVAVAWYTYAANYPRVRVAFSRDGGESFAAPVDVAVPSGRRTPIGRVDLVLDGEQGVVSFVEAEREQGNILLRRVSPDGRLGTPLVAADVRTERNSGFPRMERLGDSVFLVWTEAQAGPRLRAQKIALAAVPALASGAGAPAAALASRPPAAPGDRAPEYHAVDLEGRSVSLAALRGRGVLLNVWATWCEPCRQEMPELVALAKRYPDLAAVAVSVDEKAADAKVQRYVERRGLTLTIWRDAQDTISRLLGIETLPVTLVIDGTGTITYRRDGSLRADDATLERAVRSALRRP